MKPTNEQRSSFICIFLHSHLLHVPLPHTRTLLCAPVYSIYASHEGYLLHSLYCIYDHIGYRGVGVKQNIVDAVRSDLTSSLGPRHTNACSFEALVTRSLDSDKIRVPYLGEFDAQCATGKQKRRGGGRRTGDTNVYEL